MNWAASHLANKKELQTEGIAFKGREGVRQGITKKKKKKTKQRIISGKVTILRGGNEVIRRITLLVLTGKF